MSLDTSSFNAFIIVSLVNEKDVYNCGNCNQEYNTRKRIMRHIKEQHRNELNCWICKVCDAPYVNELTLRRHIRVRHKSIWKCEVCKKFFNSEQVLKKHFETHEATCTLNWKCGLCSEQYTDKEDLRNHYHEKHGTENISCEENNHQLDPLEETNIKGSKNQRPYCEACDAKFEFGAVYIRHLGEKHNLQVQKFNFDTEADFISWKYAQETKHVVQFQLQAVRKDDAETLKLYICSQQGISTEMRCPAHMQVTISKDGVHCEYLSEHWYHKCDDVNSAANDELGMLTNISANIQISQVEDAHDDVDKSFTAPTTTTIDFEVNEPVKYDPILHIKIEPNEQYLNKEPDVDSNESCLPSRCYSEQNKTSVNEIPIKNIDFEVDEPVQYDPVFDIKITESNERYLNEEPDVNSNENCLPSRYYNEQNKTSVNEIPIKNPTINETDVVIKDDYNTEKVLDDDGNDATIVSLKNPENLSPATISNSGTDDEIGTFFTTMCEMTRSLPLIEQLKIKTLLRNAVLDAHLTSV